MMERLTNITIKEMIQTCQGFPSEWEVFTTKNELLYIRYRLGCLRVIKIAKHNKQFRNWRFSDSDEILFIWNNSKDKYDGDMDTEHMLCVTGLQYNK